MTAADVRHAFLADLDAALSSPGLPGTIVPVVTDHLVRLADSLEPPAETVLDTWRRDPDLTVLVGWWAPGMTLGPHDHQLWLVAGVFAGVEDNHLFTRAGHQLHPTGLIHLRAGQTLALGPHDVHAVANAQPSPAGVVQVYGGDLFSQDRTFFDHAKEDHVR